MPLNNTQVKNAKPRDKQYKLADSAGMYLLVHPNGSRYWRMDYRFAGKRKTLAIGVYPECSLSEAREERDEARKAIKANTDPMDVKRMQKLRASTKEIDSFEGVAKEWYGKQLHSWVESHSVKVMSRLTKHLFPFIGKRHVGSITPPELLAVLRRIEERGAIDTAHRVKQLAGQIFRYAIATGRAERDPSQDLRGALSPVVPTHFSAITEPEELGRLLVILDSHQGTAVVRAALQLAPLVFVRPSELRKALWSEVNFDTCEWRIPSERMKQRQDHIVPLSNKAIEILTGLRPITSRSEYIFPSVRSAKRPMSDNAVLAAMRTLGIEKDVMSGHGFRATARTILDEVLGFRVDLIEHQLAHKVKDANGTAYNRTKFLPQRKEMMQKWADYLDSLRLQAKNGNVIPINQKSS